MSCSAAAATRSPTRQAPSSNEYSLWTCRCTKLFDMRLRTDARESLAPANICSRPFFGPLAGDPLVDNLWTGASNSRFLWTAAVSAWQAIGRIGSLEKPRCRCPAVSGAGSIAFFFLASMEVRVDEPLGNRRCRHCRDDVSWHRLFLESFHAAADREFRLELADHGRHV